MTFITNPSGPDNDIFDFIDTLIAPVVGRRTIDHLYEDGNGDITSNFPAGAAQYWPNTLIRQLVKRRVIRSELDKSIQAYDQELVDYILKDAGRLFTISALIDSDRTWLLNAMNFFRKYHFQDSELSAEVSAKCLVKEALSSLDSKLWSRGRASRICEMQWKVLVPVISTEIDNYDFHAKAILPFTKLRTVDGGGAFSTLSHVEIREGHFKDPTCLDVSYNSLALQQTNRRIRLLSGPSHSL